MLNNIATNKQLVAENKGLREQLENAETSLRDIQSGEADALFVSGTVGAEIFAVKGADQAYRILVENMCEGALTLAPNGLILYANQRFAEILGTPLEKVIGSDIHEWFASESRQVVQTLLLKDMHDKHSKELVLTAVDGMQVPVYVSVNRIVQDGELDAYCMVVTDLTEQKRIEAILAEEKLEHAILEQATDVIVICDQGGRIIRASKQAQLFNDNNLIGQQFVQAFPLRRPDGTDISPDGSINVDSCQSLEARLDYNAKEFDFLISIGHLTGVRGELLGSVVTLTDITGHKQTERALRTSEDLTRNMLMQAPIGIATIDSFTGQIYEVNPRFAEIAGRTMEEMVKIDWLQITHPDDIQADLDNMALLNAGKVNGFQMEKRYLHPDGTTIWIDMTISSMKVRDKAQPCHLCMIQDITERKQTEATRDRLAVILESTTDLVIIGDSAGFLIYLNRAAYTTLGVGLEEDITQMKVADFISKSNNNPGLTEGVPTAIREGTWTGETILINRSGLEIPVSQVILAHRDSNGKIDFFSTIMRNIAERKKSELKLLESERRFTDMLGNVELISVMRDREGRITYCNEYLLHLTGWRYEEIIGKNWIELFELPEIAAQKKQYFVELLLNKPEARHHEGKIVTRSREHRLIRWNNMLLRSEVGEVIGTASIGEDITERKKSEADIIYLNRILSVLSSINTLIVRVTDCDELFRESCDIAIEKGGFRLAMIDMVDQNTMQPLVIASAGQDEELLVVIKKAMSSGDSMQNSMVARALREKKAIISNDILIDPEVLYGSKYAEEGVNSISVIPLIIAGEAVGTFSLYANEIDFFHENEMLLLNELADDIAFAIDHIGKQERLKYLAYYDVLTGLANRDLFLDRVTQYIHSAANGGYKLAMGLIDLDRFKNINNILGRPTGDVLLQQTAAWLTQKMGDTDLVGRIDADHFAFVVPEVKIEGDLVKLVEKLIADFQAHSFPLNDTTFRISIKVGFALFPDDGDNADSLFRNAEVALNKAKASGDGFLFYKLKMNEEVADNLAIENKLRQAIDNEEFVLHYQPKINLVSGKITGAEALIRWNDPRTGLVPPGQFIPILEETGLIYQVGRWALHKAIEDNLRWRVAGLPAVRIAVNVSPLQLRNINFIDEIRQEVSLDEHAVDGLELEITESLIMENVKLSITTLQAIRAMGITIAIDDFGTGFSSLNYLSKLPVDTLKIDRNFVIEMNTPEGLSLVSTIIILAHALKLKVVAEGVETEEQSRQLLSLNCDEMQGFLFSEPVPAEIFEARFMVPPSVGKK